MGEAELQARNLKHDKASSVKSAFEKIYNMPLGRLGKVPRLDAISGTSCYGKDG